MKAITIRQPWAAWIFTPHITKGRKDVENRTWRTKHRGPLAIHAGLKVDEPWADLDMVRDVYSFKTRDEQAWTRGAIIGIVDLVDIVPIGESRLNPIMSRSPWATFGQNHWLLANPRLLPIPIQLPGMPGLFNVDLDVDYSPKAS